MAHATTASASSQSQLNVDARLKNLKKNILPDYPLRLTQVNDPADTRRPAGNCKHCGQVKDNCFCYAHHTFLSREEMTTYSDKSSNPDATTSSKSYSSGAIGTPNSSLIGTSSGSGKKLTLDAYKKIKQEGGSATGRSTPKDVPSPAETPQSRDQPTKSKTLQSSNLSHLDHPASHSDNDRPTKKLKTSTSTAVPVQKSPAIKSSLSTVTNAAGSKPQRSPSKKTLPAEDVHTHHDKKSNVSRSLPQKRETSTSRPKSPLTSSQTSSKGTQSRTRRSPSPPERPREKVHAISKRDEREGRHKVERQIAKDHDRPPPRLPKMLSPLPDELNRLVDEYERKHAVLIKEKDTDGLSMDEDIPKKTRKAVGERISEKAPSRPESRNTTRSDTDGRSTKSERRENRTEQNSKESESASHQVAFKVPAKRPPADAMARAREQDRESHLVVRLNYGYRNAGKVKKILRSEVDRSKCPKCALESDDRPSAEPPISKATSRDKSPNPLARVAGALKSTPTLKGSANGKIATPNRKTISASERPRSSDQSSSRLSGPSTDRDYDDLGDNDMLRADSEGFMALGIRLKHKADAALGVKNSEEANLNHALVYACHCVIAYFLSFGLDDELRRRERRRSNISDGWKSVVAYIEFLLSSRLKANAALHGLLYQMGAICSERVSLYEQQRMLSVSLPDAGQPNENTTKSALDSVRRRGGDLVKILQTNHEWWNLGHQRLPWSVIQNEYQKTWSKRSHQIVKKPHVVAGNYLTPFYLPLYSGSSAFEAATFAWMVTQEWKTQAGLNLDTGLHLTWPKREDRD